MMSLTSKSPPYHPFFKKTRQLAPVLFFVTPFILGNLIGICRVKKVDNCEGITVNDQKGRVGMVAFNK